MKEPQVQALDTLHYFYSFIHEPLIRCIITFSGHIDEDALRKAVDLAVKALPVIKCGFEVKDGKPRWFNGNYSADDIVKLIESGGDIESQALELAVSVIDISSGPQVKIFILRGETFDKLIIVINHMVCDGSGFKEYIYLLARLYTGFAQNSSCFEDLSELDRSMAPLIGSLKIKDKIKILSSKTQLEKQKNDIVFDFKGDKTNPFIEKRRIEKDIFDHARSYAKKNDVTLNDIFMAEYMRIIVKETGNSRAILPCPVDLRRFINKKNRFGISNLTSNYICDISIEPGEPFIDTVQKVSGEMKRQKSDISCIKPVMLLGIGFRLLSFAKLRKVFNDSFTIPVVSYTNLGVLDRELLVFGNTEITDAYLTGAVKYVPYFQISVSSYDETITLTCNMYGTDDDRNRIRSILELFENEMSDNTRA